MYFQILSYLNYFQLKRYVEHYINEKRIYTISPIHKTTLFLNKMCFVYVSKIFVWLVNTFCLESLNSEFLFKYISMDH